jgi:hypothetical protein
VRARRRDLAPAAGRSTVEHNHSGLEQPVLVVDLGELEGRAAAIALPLSRLDIRIVELALQPARRGELPALGGFDAHREAALATRATDAAPTCTAFASLHHLFNPPIAARP